MTLITPARPATDSRWPTLVFTLPTPQACSGSASPRCCATRAKASFKPSISIGSPFGVPVPCASTYVRVLTGISASLSASATTFDCACELGYVTVRARPP
ncbi:hypothetical protein MJ904_20245 [Massilia sp. MB5]|nr:hypothetical protein [Massilia sp. MB5]UMR33468.1 hypothetical protein MJ904_20245 [Massilia sp. MB5]